MASEKRARKSSFDTSDHYPCRTSRVAYLSGPGSVPSATDFKRDK